MVLKMIRVRKAKIDDLDAIMELWSDFLDEHRARLESRNPRFMDYFAFKKNAFDMAREYNKDIIKRSNSEIHLAEDNGRIAAYNLIEIKPGIPVFIIDRFGYIGDLYVKEEFRGKKVSSKLYEEAKKWFKKHGVKYVSIGVNPENKEAHGIYKKWGFFDFRIEMRNEI